MSPMRTWPFVLVGLNHRTAGMELRERLAISSTELPNALEDLRSAASQALILSTCNRVEIYADVDRFHGSVAAVCASSVASSWPKIAGPCTIAGVVGAGMWSGTG